MFLILESIGTSELILIGIVALIFLGPRKMPQMARKIGKMMAEFRGTANEFKSTWEREASFEEESKAFDLDRIEAEAGSETVERGAVVLPSITAIDAEQLPPTPDPEPKADSDRVTESKENWL
jgi:Tat protein translocase TatB subunit